ncbi:MAG TPA: TraB/GumN family protein [Rhizomicrobium sp.]|nr:TraB/GumN family protein [Rhizomicrobium sp.]
MRRILLFCVAAAALCLPARAQNASPAFWTIHGPKGTVYLVSSLHLLPPQIDWHRPEIDRAMQSADSFVFEVPTGESERGAETQFILENGLLPAGEKLSMRLTPDGRRDFHRALELAGVEQRNIDQKRPWLAEVVLTVQSMYRRNYSALHTPEGEAHDFAARNGKEVRYFDTTEQQMEFLAGADRSNSTEQFSAVLADFPNQPEREDRFVEAWAAGDVTMSASLVAAGLRDLPDEQRLLNERNRDWASQIEGMLGEKHTFFVAVGIAHLVGPGGVPALLRAHGVTVEGP